MYSMNAQSSGEKGGSRSTVVVCSIKEHSWKNKLCHVMKKGGGRSKTKNRNVLIRCIAKDIVFLQDAPNIPLLQVDYFHNTKWKSKFVDILMTMCINLLWIDQSVVSEEDELELEQEEFKTASLQKAISSASAPTGTLLGMGGYLKLSNVETTPATIQQSSSLLFGGIDPGPGPTNHRLLKDECLTVLPSLKIEPNIGLSLLTPSQCQQLTRVVANTNSMLEIMTLTNK